MSSIENTVASDASAPLPSYSRASTSSREPLVPLNPVDEFFGYTLSQSSTRDSRHDRRLSAPEELPSYAESQPPAYTVKDEPVTLAMFLFKFGFLFPPFWILGAIILLSPLRAAPEPTPSTSWLPNKTEAEQTAFIAHMRKVEVKWARRCLIALMVLLCVGATVGVTVWAVLRA